MKKILSLFAIAAMSITLFTACDDDNDTPELKPVDVSEGVFIINSGNSRSSIDGSLTYINTTTNTATQNVFKTANGNALGKTANDAVVYGSKLYVVVTGENSIEVVDRNTVKSVKHISTTELMGTDKGTQPRHIIADGGKVYVSTFAGYVAAIDTTSFAADKIYQAGSYPEGMAISNGVLYVANSDYGNGVNPSISAITLTTGTTTEYKNELIKNPVDIVAANGAIYILDSGSYDASYNQIGAGVIKVENGTYTKIADATMMALSTEGIAGVTGAHPVLYLINNPYGASETTYSIYNLSTDEKATFIDGSDIFSPNAIGVDPVTRNVYILSYSKNPDTGYAGYALPGYVVEYSSTGTKLQQYNTGVGPTAITFNTAVKYE